MTTIRSAARSLGLLILVGTLLALPADAKKSKKEKEQEQELIAQLPQVFQQFMRDAHFLLSDEEREAFLALDEDYERQAFIDEFWKSRDPYPNTSRNEFEDQWRARLELARQFEDPEGDRSRILLLNGIPDGRVEINCSAVWPAEVWFYAKSARIPEDLLLLFYRRYGQFEWRLWQPLDGLRELVRDDATISGRRNYFEEINSRCLGDNEAIVAALRYGFRQGPMGFPLILMRLFRTIEAPSSEWVSGFASYSTDLPPEAPTFPAETSFEFPGRHQSRTIVQGRIKIALEEVATIELGGATSRNLLLTGEILRGSRLFDRFRYKYDFPGEQAPVASIPLVFQRHLRAGTYRVILRVEDVNGKQFYRADQELVVPAVENEPPPPADPTTAALLAEATAAVSRLENTIEIIEPPGDMQLGQVRFDTLSTGSDIAHVRFTLDGTAVLEKRRPPFSVELDLGKLPRSQRLAAIALDLEGNEVARDEILINGSSHRFEVRIDQPRTGERFRDSFFTNLSIQVPEGQRVERVELFLDEKLVATLYQPPYEQTLFLTERDQITYLRARAYLPDGNSTEDHVFVNAPGDLEEIEIQLVELYTTVRDRTNRPVEGLTEADFRVSEDKAPQTIRRFEKVENLPFHAAILLDVSASMEPNLPEAQQAALAFFQGSLSPRDRAALITFNDRPYLAQKFTNQLVSLGGSLAGLKAERGTSLYDSIIFSLYYFNGIRGQRALLVLSDGKDEGSRFDFEETLDFTRRAGVTLYTIGLGFGRGEFDAKRKLTKLAEETGGQSFFVEDAAELKAIYQQIEQELRSQYLIAYQSTNSATNGDFRAVEVEVEGSGLSAETIRGYYP